MKEKNRNKKKAVRKPGESDHKNRALNKATAPSFRQSSVARRSDGASAVSSAVLRYTDHVPFPDQP